LAYVIASAPAELEFMRFLMRSHPSNN